MAKDKRTVDCDDADLVIVLKGALPKAEKLDNLKDDHGVLEIPECKKDRNGDYDGTDGWRAVAKDGAPFLIDMGGGIGRKGGRFPGRYKGFAASGAIMGLRPETERTSKGYGAF